MPDFAVKPPGCELDASAVHRPAVRVMHVVHCLGTHGRTGGMEYGLIKLVNGLEPARVLSAICSTRRADPAVTGLLDTPVHHYDCDGRRNGNDPRVVLALTRTFRAFRPHVVHTHSWGTLVEGLVAARLAGVPLVVHGEHGTLQTRRSQLFVQRMVWGWADQVLSVSSLLADRIAREVSFPRGRIRTIRNGVDVERFSRTSRSEARQALDLTEATLAIGTVGRLVEVKDHVTLLHGFARLALHRPDVALLLAGEGPLAESLARLAAELGISAQVRFLGHRRDVERVYPALDVFVLSSQSEGMSNTIQEAMASGVPVIATKVGGAEELIVDGVSGVLVPPRNPEALGAALIGLCRDERIRLDMGRAARDRARQEFSVERMIAEYTVFYEELAANAILAGGLTSAAPYRPATPSAAVYRPETQPSGSVAPEGARR